MQARAERERLGGRRLALVPTMGALHRGHLALVEEAKRRADHVTVSIFVNPTQFGPGEDFERYPRRLEEDLEKLETAGGVDVVFAPSVGEMYPTEPARTSDGVAPTSVEVERTSGGVGQASGGAGRTSSEEGRTSAEVGETSVGVGPTSTEGERTSVEVGPMAEHLCGRHRPGHFRGVATVVAKLLHLGRPHVAVFGLKDAQQFLILRQMVRDLHFGVEMVGIPIVREADGLALSSRNVYLSPSERAQAVVLSQAVGAARRAIEGGERRPEALVEAMLRALGQAEDARVEYAEVVSQRTLRPPKRIAPGQDVLAAVAVHFGATRLIDNAFVTAP